MYRLIFLIINCLSIRSQARQTLLDFQYYPSSTNRFTAFNIYAYINPRDSSTTAYILTGIQLSKTSLHITSVNCTHTICSNHSPNYDIIIEQIFDRNNVLRIEEGRKNLRQILDNFWENPKANLTCSKKELLQGTIKFPELPLSKTSLSLVILLSIFVFLSCVLCFAWIGYNYYCRYDRYRRKKKFLKALALSVQQMYAKSPIIIFNSNNPLNENSDDDPVCSICIESFVDNDKLRKLVCSHYFHVACIDPWLLSHENCPLCNQNVLNDSIPSISAHVAPANRELESIDASN